MLNARATYEGVRRLRPNERPFILTRAACPDAELFAEWMELGALQPFFRNHSEKAGCRREPWLFGNASTRRGGKSFAS